MSQVGPFQNYIANLNKMEKSKVIRWNRIRFQSKLSIGLVLRILLDKLVGPNKAYAIFGKRIYFGHIRFVKFNILPFFDSSIIASCSFIYLVKPPRIVCPQSQC